MKLPAWVAVGVVGIAVVAAGYGGWQLIKPAPQIDLSQYESNEGRGRPRPAAAPVAALREGVTLNPDGSGAAQLRNFGVQFLAGAKPTIVARGQAAPSVDDRPIVRTRNQVLNDANVRKAANVTDAQLAKLRALSVTQPPAIDASTRAALTDLWAKLRAADPAARPAAEKAVLDAVRTAADKHAAASAAAFHTLADQVRGVLTADQIAKVRAAR